jgi:regulator of sigma E protease
MGSALGNLLAFVIAISVLVAVHEYGHYIVGRWTGMKVLRFSIGFGKPIWTRIGGKDRTEYCISAIPLGGYVRFLDTREGPIPESDEGRAFNQRPVPQRIAVLLAGPAFNFLFAIVAYWALFVYGIPTLVPAVGEVEPGSYAAQAGLEQGDRIVGVGDVETADWESALLEMLDQMISDGRVPLTLEAEDGWRRDATIDVGADARRLTEPGMLFEGLGFRPFGADDLPADIGRVEDDGPAIAAGIQPGDRIVALDGLPIMDFGDLVDAVQSRANKTVSVDYERDGRFLLSAAFRSDRLDDPGHGTHLVIDRLYAAYARAHGDRRRFHKEHQRSNQYRAVRRRIGTTRAGLLSRVPRDRQHQSRRSQSVADSGTRRRPDRLPVNRRPEGQSAVGTLPDSGPANRHIRINSVDELRFL